MKIEKMVDDNEFTFEIKLESDVYGYREMIDKVRKIMKTLCIMDENIQFFEYSGIKLKEVRKVGQHQA